MSTATEHRRAGYEAAAVELETSGEPKGAQLTERAREIARSLPREQEIERSKLSTKARKQLKKQREQCQELDR